MSASARSLALTLGLALALGIVAVAAPACAQIAPAPSPAPLQPYAQTLSERQQLDLLRAQQELAARQAVIQQTQLFSLETQLRTQLNLASLQALGVTPTIPPPAAGAPPRDIDVSGLASMPDATLASSNARVRAAAGNQP